MKKTSDSTVVTVHQRYLPGAGPAVQLALNPLNMGDRASGLSDSYANFRLKSLRFRLHPTSGANGVGFLVGSANTTPPGTLPVLAEIVPSTYSLGQETVCSNWVVVSKSDLAGPLPWYKTQTTTGNDEFPGYLVTIGVNQDVEYFAAIEFKGSVDPANTPAWQEFRRKYREEVAMRQAQAERDRLVSILAVKGLQQTTPGAAGQAAVPK